MKDNFYNLKQKAHISPDIKRDDCQLVAIDTNVFIDMSHHMRDNKKVTGFYGKIREIRLKAEQGQIRFVITPSVLSELAVHGLSPIEVEFIKKYCVILEPKDKQAFAKEAVSLSREYIRSGAMKPSNTPWGDALIMAESTIAGLNILTNNYKDFVVYKDEHGGSKRYKHDKYDDIVPRTNYKDDYIPENLTHMNENELVSYLKLKKRFRALDIGRVNYGMNYGYKNKNGYTVIPMPFTTTDYIGKRSEKEGLWRTNQFVTNFNSSKLDLVPYEMGQE